MEINKQHHPLVSIIIPSYNYGIYIKECLNSVLVQTYKNWECLIIDNGSTDDTKKIVNEYVKNDSRFKYIYIDKMGVSIARNEGVRQSSGKYILPLDADDKIGKKYLELGVNELEKNEKIKVVYCQAEYFGIKKGIWQMPDFSIKQILIENVLFCSSIYRRVDFDRINGYNEEMKLGFEDWDFWLNLLKEGGEVIKIPHVLFYYRIRKTSRNNSLDFENQRQLRKQIFENHKELYFSVLSFSDVIFDYKNNKNLYLSILQSPDYKIGKILLTPIRFIKRLFSK